MEQNGEPNLTITIVDGAKPTYSSGNFNFFNLSILISGRGNQIKRWEPFSYFLHFLNSQLTIKNCELNENYAGAEGLDNIIYLENTPFTLDNFKMGGE